MKTRRQRQHDAMMARMRERARYDTDSHDRSVDVAGGLARARRSNGFSGIHHPGYEYRRGECPDCDLGGPAAIALVPGERCLMCGGYPAGEYDEADPFLPWNQRPPTPRPATGGVPGWTTALSSTRDEAASRSILRQAFPGWTRKDHEAAAARFVQAHRRLDKEWGQEWNLAFFESHGRPPKPWDYRVSGIGNNNLPEDAKRRLGGLADAAERAANLAAAHAAAGKHLRRRRP